ncbi:unnamed protein product [Tilletia laevis]|uniref:Uncharacterized protein n=3 Tax=Tilletia TaxID=13289 RepID=A0A8X7MVC2_9BASI|nr:hypothetical protein CF336_g1510 [Tilletia laevis]KAE8202013.1 hypothetical protein CF328_g2462 [Tilletia controversa]KAE8264129.1 hypothetical protein A4X03_0g1170 [Tilletia caries]KAE8206536.1 hypothetical protein CF335_g1805 [Tilletia laevis]KAE8249939.1 hypothetical protein A4X06_0g3001 [Tilletia controversa]
MHFLFSLAALLVLVHPLLAARTATSSPPSNRIIERQAPPNTIATRFPDAETASLNLTFFVLPAPIAVAKQIAGEFALLSSFRERLPASVSATPRLGKESILCSSWRTTALSYAPAPIVIPELSEVQTFAGFVDCTGDGSTACFRQYAGYFDQLVFALLGNVFAATRLFGGTLNPPHSPYKPLGSGRYGLNVSDAVGGLLGAGRPYISSFTFATSSEGLSGELAQELLDAPLVRSLDNRCFKSIYFFNETTTPIRNIVGDVDVRSPLVPSQGLASQRLATENVQGVTAAVQRKVTTQSVKCSTYAKAA